MFTNFYLIDLTKGLVQDNVNSIIDDFELAFPKILIQALLIVFTDVSLALLLSEIFSAKLS